jgi:hypothetical protein
MPGGVLVIWMASVVGGAPPGNTNTAPPASPPGGNLLTDKAQWDPSLFRAYCKLDYKLDVTDSPKSFQGQELITSKFNPEFVKRLYAMIAFYQAEGKNDMGIVPGDGAFRSPDEQHKLYKIGRITKDGAKDSDDPNDWGVPDPPGKIKPRTQNWIGWHNFGLATDLCQYSGSTPTVVVVNPSTKEMGITLPGTAEYLLAFQEVGPQLGFIWGGWYRSLVDRFHYEWHPGRHDCENYGASGVPDPQFSDLYTSKIPQTIYSWTGDKQSPDANVQTLHVLTVKYDNHWIAVEAERTIVRTKDGSWTGRWTTYDPPARVFPGWVPTRNFDIGQNAYAHKQGDDFVRQNYAYTTTIHTSSYGYRVVDNSKQFGSLDSTVQFCPDCQIFDWEIKATQDIFLHNYSKATYDQTCAMYAAVRYTSTYDVDLGVSAVNPPGGNVVTAHGMNQDKDGYTYGDPSKAIQHNVTPAGPYMRFAWVRATGQVGLSLFDHIRYYVPVQVTSLYVEPHLFQMVSGTLPPGAFDQPASPPWPSPNPRP